MEKPRFLLFSSAAALAMAAPPAHADAGPGFVAETADDAVEIGYGVAAGDVDGDGKPDILLADKRQIRWYRNPEWTPFVMAERLTLRDNVCIAARDLDGDGKVEVAAGGQWNPGETSDREESGATFYLVPPDDRTQKWDAVALPHDPTVHRMRWVRLDGGGKENPDARYALAVLPLHGAGNSGGKGDNTVELSLHKFPGHAAAADAANWELEKVDTGLHTTHNFDIVAGATAAGGEGLLVAGDPEVRLLSPQQKHTAEPAGEVRGAGPLVATIEPMHGNTVAVQEGEKRTVLDESLNQGHALAIGDLLGTGDPQVVAGWREPDADGKVGIRIYHKGDGGAWATSLVDDNTMACEDLTLSDLDGDGDLDIVAAGRATQNLVVYWNQRENGKE